MNRKPLNLRVERRGAVPDVAMVMAAGLGKRMRPLTATRPKPLVEVAGKPLIDHSLDRLRAAGVRKVVVNVHYLADALEAHLKRYAADLDVTVSDERKELLETGGGMIKAREHLGEAPFLTVNSDNLWVDGPIDAINLLSERWDDTKMDALLLLVPQARAHGHGGRGDFHMDAVGRLIRRKTGRVAPFVYTGVQLVSPRLLDDALTALSTNVLWDQAIAKGRLYGVVHQGLWFDVGTPQAIPLTEAMLADG